MQKVAGVILISIFLYGCSASRKSNVVPVEETTAVSVSDKAITDRNITNRNFYIQKAEIQFYDGDETVNLLATLKYKKEGRYLVSIKTKSGVEVVRILLANDTIIANDRINKKLYKGSTTYLESKYGISFRLLPVILGDYIFDNSLKDSNINCKNGKAPIYKTIENRRIDFIINCREKKVEVASFNSKAGEGKIEIKLGDFKRAGNYFYPGTSNITDSNSKSEIKVEIKKIEFDTDDNVKFIRGANYEEIILK